MGAKAAANVIIFQALDREKTGRLCFKDLTRIFADVPDIGFEKASEIAQSILKESAKDPQQGMTFQEFMHTLEGSNLGFQTYLKHVQHMATLNLRVSTRDNSGNSNRVAPKSEA